MKKTILLLMAVGLSFAAFSQNNTPKADSSYSCPMHPDVKGTATTKCNKCGMALTPTKTYVCPMHADVTSTDKKAKCTKCGMSLTEVKVKKN
jgi:hypothetical protein